MNPAPASLEPAAHPEPFRTRLAVEVMRILPLNLDLRDVWRIVALGEWAAADSEAKFPGITARRELWPAEAVALHAAKLLDIYQDLQAVLRPN